MAVKLGNGNWAVKEDKLLAYNDNSGLFFNKEFDFSRGSTATYVGRDGLIASAASGVPRIDFTNDTKGHLLLEPSTTNLITYSEDFSQWGIFGGETGSVTYVSDLVNPDGSVGGYKISNSGAFLSSTLTTTTQRNIYARSVSGTGNAQLMTHNSNTNNIFTLTEQWQRFDLNSASSLGVTTFYIDLRGSETTLDEIYVWGANATNDQDYPTSYIPTTGAASTRNADVCNNSGSAQDFNSEEGVLYAEISALADDGTNRAISLSDGTTINQIVLRYYGTSNSINVFVRVGLSFNAVFTSSLNVTDFNKIALKYKENDFALWINGVEVATDSSGAIYPVNTLNELSFDRGDGSDDFYGNVKNVQVFTEALTDEQLEKLTS